LLTLIALITVLCFDPRLALAKAKTVAVVVEGPDADVVRAAITAAVPHGTPLADAGAFKSALAGQGVRTPFGKALDEPARDKTLARVRRAAAAAGVDGTLIARVTRSRKERHVALLLVATSGAAGDLEDDVVLGAKPSKDDDAKVAASVGTALVDYRAAPGEANKPPPPAKSPAASEEPTAPEPASPPPTQAEPAEAEPSNWQHPRGIVGHNLFELDLGAGAMGRSFGYSTDANSSLNLRPYSVFPAASASLQAEIYPLADSRDRVLRDLGIVGGYSRTLFLQSTLGGGGGTIDTTGTSYFGGLRWRTMPMGDGGLQLGLSLNYAAQAFEFGTVPTTATATAGALPSVSYQSVRPAVDVRVPIGKLSILAQAGFRAVLSAGSTDDVAMRFRGTTTTGFDVGGGLSLLLAPGWEVRVLADYEGYFYSFRPSFNFTTMSGDAYRAVGATDQMFGAHLAIAAVF
jgi:hypothetical protein